MPILAKKSAVPCRHKALLKEKQQGYRNAHSQSQSDRKRGEKIVKKFNQIPRFSRLFACVDKAKQIKYRAVGENARYHRQQGWKGDNFGWGFSDFCQKHTHAAHQKSG